MSSCLGHIVKGIYLIDSLSESSGQLPLQGVGVNMTLLHLKLPRFRAVLPFSV